MKTAIAFFFLSTSCFAQSIVVSGGEDKSITATGSQFIEQIENRLGVVETNVSKLKGDVSQIRSDVGFILEKLDQKSTVVKPPQTPTPVSPVVDEKPKSQPQKTPGRKKFLAMFTAPWCSICQVWDRNHRHRLESAGFVVRKYDMNLPENQAKYGNPAAKMRVISLPTFIVCDWDTGEWIGDPIVGSVSADVLIPLLRSNEESSPLVKEIVTLPQASGFADWGGVRYDLSKWKRMCSMRNCQMCNYLDAKQAEYFASLRLINSVEVPSPESASPDDVIDEGLDLLTKNGLDSNSLLCDPGCGDARVLVKAVERTGCFGVGIEINPEKVKKARELIASKGLESRITIVEGDAREFDFEKSRVTHVYCYLYPELLGDLSGELSKVPVVVSAGHRIPGLENQQAIGQCHLRLL